MQSCEEPLDSKYKQLLELGNVGNSAKMKNFCNYMAVVLICSAWTLGNTILAFVLFVL